MQRLTYTKAHNLSSLSDELVVAIPALSPTMTGLNGRASSPFSLSENGNQIILEVPDAISASDVAAVIQAHTNPAVVPPLTREEAVSEAFARVDVARAGATTVGEVNDAIETLLTELTPLLGG